MPCFGAEDCYVSPRTRAPDARQERSIERSPPRNIVRSSLLRARRPALWLLLIVVPKIENPALDPTLESVREPELAALEIIARLPPGQVLGDRYRIERPLGQGGMGVVYAAAHQHTGRAVAIKFIECAWNDERLELYQRFLGEARAAAAIRHPNVIDVLDMGFLSGAPYLVMERLTGESLDELLIRLEVLPLESSLGWLLPVMGALAALHDKGIVHRDVKPSNIFLSYDEGKRVVPKLLDFGLARVTRDAPLTHPGVMLGTPEYMAPERARGQEVGPAADVWAMGVVTFECLCGKLPFTATNLNGLAAQLVAGEVQRAHAVNPRLPIAIAAAIDRALMNAPEQRHENMAAFAHALGAAALSAGLSVPADPDPIGLPNFPRLHLQGQAWVSGPMAKAARPGPARASVPLREPSASVTRKTRARAWTVPLLLVALSLLGLVASLWLKPSALVSPAPPAFQGAPASSRPVAAPPVHQSPAPVIRDELPQPADLNMTRRAAAPDPARPAAAVEARAQDSERPRTQRTTARSNRRKADNSPPLSADEFEKEWN
jgi:serine/threonine protein kinase